MESEVLRRFYSDIQHAITDPIAVASLLHQEDVVGEVLLDEVSPTNKVSPVEKTASIMRHVEAAIRVDPKSFWVFLSVLDQFTPSYKVARRMKQAVAMHASAAERKKTLASSQNSKDEVTVSVVYKEDFDAIEMEFVSLHLRASYIILEKSSVTLQKLKELLSFYPQLEMPIRNAENVTEVMQVLQRHSSFINCSYLKHVAEYFSLPEVTKEIDNYNKLVDDFCNSKIIQHSYMKPFTTNPPQYNMSSQTIKIKIVLEWNPAAKTLSDIRSLLRKAFKGLSPLIHVDVISEGSVTVICYAPHYLMGALVKMAEESKSMLLENSVSYLSIGYTVVLGSGAQEKTALENKVHSLTQKNRSMMLSLMKLWEKEDKQLLLEKKIHDLQQENESLQGDVPQKYDYLQQIISAQVKTVSQLEDELKLVRREVTFLTEKKKSLQDKCEDLQSLLPQSTEEKIRDLRQENSSLQLTVTTLQERCQELHMQLSQLVEMQSDIVSKQPLKKRTTDLGIQSQTQLDELVELSMSKKPQLLSDPQTQITTRHVETGLRHIPVTLKGVTPDSFRYMMKHQGVESIEFKRGGATTEQVEAIFQELKYNTSLHELKIPRTKPPVDMSILSALLTVNNTLRALTLMSYDRDDHVMEQLSSGLRANISVTKLKLDFCITDTGVQHLATILAVNATLQELDLSCVTTDNVVSHLSRSLQHNSSVTDLDLSYNSYITNMGAVALGEMLRVNKSLRKLNLCRTSVGEEGATALMEGLQHNQVLNELWLPQRLEEYCKKHTLYGSVESTIKFGFC